MSSIFLLFDFSLVVLHYSLHFPSSVWSSEQVLLLIWVDCEKLVFCVGKLRLLCMQRNEKLGHYKLVRI